MSGETKSRGRKKRKSVWEKATPAQWRKWASDDRKAAAEKAKEVQVGRLWDKKKE